MPSNKLIYRPCANINVKLSSRSTNCHCSFLVKYFTEHRFSLSQGDRKGKLSVNANQRNRLQDALSYSEGVLWNQALLNPSGQHQYSQKCSIDYWTWLVTYSVSSGSSSSLASVAKSRMLAKLPTCWYFQTTLLNEGRQTGTWGKASSVSKALFIHDGRKWELFSGKAAGESFLGWKK